MMWMRLAIHGIDETLTGFLSVYNPTVLALRAKLGFWPMPTFGYREWLTGLCLLITALALLSPFAFRNARWIRPIFLFVVIVAGVLNPTRHTIATLFGHTPDTGGVSPPPPGVYFSLLFFFSSLFSLLPLRLSK